MRKEIIRRTEHVCSSLLQVERTIKILDLVGWRSWYIMESFWKKNLIKIGWREKQTTPFISLIAPIFFVLGHCYRQHSFSLFPFVHRFIHRVLFWFFTHLYICLIPLVTLCFFFFPFIFRYTTSLQPTPFPISIHLLASSQMIRSVFFPPLFLFYPFLSGLCSFCPNQSFLFIS